jgi:uncharacterized damage-inducible protein DinB
MTESPIHLTNHSCYHRGQVVTLLRQLGQCPPATDFLVYLDEPETVATLGHELRCLFK